MCPKRKRRHDFGHKRSQHVPEKEEEIRFRSQEEPTCARKGRGDTISVTRGANMCPKRKRKHDFGHKKRQHVPEKEEETRFRSQEEPTCVRKGRGVKISVTRGANMCPKRKRNHEYGHKQGELGLRMRSYGNALLF
ncbi:hypothetical protein DYI25_19195 [Mesobacillus boroniphilus]|uniref:Uncharacterized protein n=1 Tax=Mesobacillus boroniphilus TaxID=308892 RepID=A0A944CQD1_9BACI|nr:hypothetical protein [Mesobacillus boroniphilus]